MTEKMKNTKLILSMRREKGLSGRKKRIRSEAGFLFRAIGELVILAYLFYRNLLVFLILLPLTVPIIRKMKQREAAKRKRKQAVRFKDGLLAVGASLQAGHSAENAIQDAAKELSLLYGEDDEMTKEFQRIRIRTDMNFSLEEALWEFAGRIGLEDAVCFAEVFRTARKTGGTLRELIQDTVRVIVGRLEVQEEIDTMLRGKQYELTFLKFIPLFIICYLNMSSPEFFQVLYTTGVGRVIMTICLGMYLAAATVADRIALIEI